ncbi:MAG: copper transporter [Candidatus Omnitrophica bacterium]|nr:copper transporter [Candidatus Omnitrophota bacterium]
MAKRLFILWLVFTVVCGGLAFPPRLYARGVPDLPVPGSMVRISDRYTPLVMTGLTIDPRDPLKFNFLIHQGDTPLEGDAFHAESLKLIKYFMAALTLDDEQMWVNLSPYEAQRVIPVSFGNTEMGRDLLAQDYLLKQLTASLMYPEDALGDRFWKRVNRQAYERFGTAEIPLNTFNKIWIVPEQARVYEHATGAVIVSSHLKVMLEEDYLALERHAAIADDAASGQGPVETNVSLQVVREVLIPEIEREVNEGRTFANLRQIYHSVILATWYKSALKNSLLASVYADRNKITGIRMDDDTVNQRIYEQYVAAYKRGVFDYIKEDYDRLTQTTIPRRYFSGGVELRADVQSEKTVPRDMQALIQRTMDEAVIVEAKLDVAGTAPHALKDFKKSEFKNNIYAKLIVLEGRLNDEEAEVQTRTAGALAGVFGEMYQGGLLSLDELEAKLAHPNRRLQAALVELLGGIYEDQIKAGEDVDLTAVRASQARGEAAEVVGRIYVERLKRGETADPNDIRQLRTSYDNSSTVSAIETAIGRVSWQLYLQRSISVDDLKALINEREANLARFIMDRLKDLHIEQVRLGGETDVQYLLDIVASPRTFLRAHAARNLADVYAARVNNGRMTLAEMESLFTDAHPDMAKMLPAALESVYVTRINAGATVNVSPLVNRLRHADSEMRRAAAGALINVYTARESAGQSYNLSPIERLLNNEKPFFARSIAPGLMDLYARQYRAGHRSLASLEDLLDHSNPAIRAGAFEVLVPVYGGQIEAGQDVDLTRLDRSVFEGPNFTLWDVVDDLSYLYALKVEHDMLAVSDLERQLNSGDERARHIAVRTLGRVYVQALAANEDISVSFLEEWLTPEGEANYRYLIDVLVEVYRHKILRGQAVNLTYFEERLNSPDNFVRREAVEVLGKLYAGMVSYGRNIRGSKNAYRFWYDNKLFVDSTLVNTRILNHVFQLEETELEETQQWLEKIRANVIAHYEHEGFERKDIERTVVPTLFFFELLVPRSSVYLLGLLESDGIPALEKYQMMLVHSRAIDALLQFRDEFPDAHIADVFRFIDLLAAFSTFNQFERVERLMSSTFSWPDHLFRMLGAELTMLFQTEHDRYTDDLKMTYMNEVFAAVPDSAKPYILLGGLRDEDRFSRREAARKAGKLTTSRDELKRALFEAVEDVDGEVSRYALESLAQIGGHRTIVRLHSILDKIKKEYVIRYIYDDHGSMVAYRDKVTIQGATADGFKFKEKVIEPNPKVAQIEDTIRAIEERKNVEREGVTIDLDQVVDQRLKKFFDFLKEHGLDEFVVVVGGGVRDAYTGKMLNDLDINIVVPMSEEDHRQVLPTTAQADAKMYDYILEKLGLLAEALGATVDDFLPPMEPEAVMWNDLEVQYTGPIALRNRAWEKLEGPRRVYLKRSIVGDNGWLYSSNTGAALLQMAIDSRGRLYGHVEALQDFDRGLLRLTGGRDNLKIGDVLRMLRLKHEFDLIISEYDYQIIRATIESYINGDLPLPEDIMRNLVLRQLIKIEETALDRELAMRELDQLGLLKLLKDKLGIDHAQLGETKGGIDLNPRQIDLFIQREGGTGVVSVPVIPRQIREYEAAIGFIPRILQISPAISN